MGVLRQYHPLCSEEFGMRSLHKHPRLKPFEDGSIRREPDLAHNKPILTSLCGSKRVVPFLKLGDEILYFTVQINGLYYLPAILKIVGEKPTHEALAEHYTEMGLPLPNNCMVEGNVPKSVWESHGKHYVKNEISSTKLLKIPEEERDILAAHLLQKWDKGYRARMKETGRCLITEKLFVELEDPPSFNFAQLKDILGLQARFSIQSFKRISSGQVQEIKELAGIN